MFNRYRCAFFAVGLALCSGALSQEQSPERPVAPPATQQQTSEQPSLKTDPVPPAIPPTEPAVREHDGRGPENADSEAAKNSDLIFGDGLAQWVMAITGVGAFFLSAWAVWLLKRTLDASRDAVRVADATVAVTRELGEAQIRAYLHCVSAKFTRQKDTVSAVIELANSGNSPASHVKVEGYCTFNDVVGRPEHTRVVGWTSSGEQDVGFPPIMAGGTATEELPFWWDLHFFTETDDDEDAERKRRVFDDGNEVSFSLIASWKDVFGKPHAFPFSLVAIVGPHPYKPNIGKSRSRQLDIRMEDARLHVAADQPEETTGE